MTDYATAFYMQTARSLAGCQQVEQALKLFLTEAFQLAKKRIGEDMVFKMSGKDYENAPLGALIKTFSRLTEDRALIDSLVAFKEERNFLAHQAIASCTDPMGELNKPSPDLWKRLADIENEARRLEIAIRQAVNPIIGKLDFDQIKDD